MEAEGAHGSVGMRVLLPNRKKSRKLHCATLPYGSRREGASPHSRMEKKVDFGLGSEPWALDMPYWSVDGAFAGLQVDLRYGGPATERGALTNLTQCTDLKGHLNDSLQCKL